MISNDPVSFEGIARTKFQNVRCSIERKSYDLKDGIKPEEDVITKVSITIPDFSRSIEKKLYEIKPWGGIPIMAQHFNQSDLQVTLFTAISEKKVGFDQIDVQYNKKQTHVDVKDINTFIKELIAKYKRGRVLIGYNDKTNSTLWGMAPQVIGRTIYYKQAKGILQFERKSNSFSQVSEESKPAIRSANPRLIPGKIDFGTYVLESWGTLRRKHYSYIAFDKGTQDWVEKVCRQVTL